MGEDRDGGPTGDGPDDFTFPVPGPAPLPAPLSAKATVVDRSGGEAPRSRGGAGPPGGARHAPGGVRGGRAPAVPRPPLVGGGLPAGHSGRGEEEGGPARPAPAGGVRPPNFKPGKVPLEKGYSQMDWMRLTARHRNLNGLNGQRPRADITMEEVRRHSTREDAWMVLRGKVYNVTVSPCCSAVGARRTDPARNSPTWASTPAGRSSS